MFKFKIANNDDEKTEIYKFRYEVGIEQCGLKQRYANHQAKTVFEPLDNMAELHVCLSNGVLVGTSRTSYAANNNIQFYADLYDIHDEINRDFDRIVIASKLLVNKSLVNSDNEKKSTSCAVELLCHQYGTALKKGIKITYLDCEHKSRLNQYYARLGFKLHKTGAVHPDTGTVNVYKLEMDDIDHLSNVKSPLRDVYLNTFSECDK